MRKSVSQLQQELDGLLDSKASSEQVMNKCYDIAARRLADSIDQEIIDKFLKESRWPTSK